MFQSEISKYNLYFSDENILTLQRITKWKMKGVKQRGTASGESKPQLAD
jgi:hypothetical protein